MSGVTCSLEGSSMKAAQHAELLEGPDAFRRFREAVKTVLRVPKNVLPARPSRAKQRKRKAK
jgi:hypothetical protein